MEIAELAKALVAMGYPAKIHLGDSNQASAQNN
jgi:hypothetical protein